mmetsp:Transcript_120670/g.341211  ORF Transcript_120670/g.341211 Transcript_120670/m.341211 type:complete len:360 (-) Transcript_120670:340-1419(-)
MKSPFEIFPASKPFSMASSLSKTFARPVNEVPSLPVIFATAPSGLRFPWRILMFPVAWMLFSTGRITSCAAKSRSGTVAKFSASVWPVHVRHSPCSQPTLSKYFITTGVPPILCTSSIRYAPLGLRSAISAVLSLRRWKSSISSSTPAVAAIASRCSTAFVEPPSALTTTIAFSKDFLVTMSRGFRFRSRRARIAFAACSHSFSFSGDTAGDDELKGSDRPRASTAHAIVFAVYMPPQAPAPGQACLTMSARHWSSMLPVMNLPYASKVETMSSFSPSRDRPVAMVPPYSISEGLLTRSIAMTQPGMFLSQPGIVTSASYHCAPMTVSILSAMISREGSEYVMPFVPMDMPSETPTVLN